MVYRILDEQVSTENRAENGETALHLAAMDALLENIELIIDADVKKSLDTMDDDGWTLIHCFGTLLPR